MDARGIQPSVDQAARRAVKIVSYDRLAQGAIEAYTSFDNVDVGRLQGQALVQAVQASGGKGEIIMLNGPTTDPNSEEFKTGAHAAIDGRLRIGAEYDTPGWSPEEAERETEMAMDRLGTDNIVGIYAANDGLAGGAAASIRDSGLPLEHPADRHGRRPGRHPAADARHPDHDDLQADQARGPERRPARRSIWVPDGRSRAPARSATTPGRTSPPRSRGRSW